MDLLVSTEARFIITPDGLCWTPHTFRPQFWERYLAVFDHVNVVARAVHSITVPDRWEPFTSHRVSLTAIPAYKGAREYLRQRRSVLRTLKNALLTADVVILRAPGRLSDDLASVLWKQHRPYGMEVVGDPWDVFAPGAVRHPLRPIIRVIARRSLAMQCMRAVAVSYVTTRTLQRRYPCRGEGIGVSDVELQTSSFSSPRSFLTHYSSVEVDKSAFVKCPRACGGTGRHRICFVGSLAQMYKGPDILIKAVAKLIDDGRDLEAVIIGEGCFKGAMVNLASQLGISNRVTFMGELPSGEPIRQQLDLATLFVLPSRTEGLPRAIIEAMARALPVIATRVGGVPELLESEDMVQPNNPAALASKIAEVLDDPARMQEMSGRNLQRARQYDASILAKARTEFYRYLANHYTSRRQVGAGA